VETIFGYKLKSSSLPLSFWLDKVPKEDLKAGFSNREYAIVHNFNFYLTEFRLRKADGNQAYVRNRVFITRNQEGQPISLIGAMEDITMKKLSEKALMESMESYHRLFNSSPLASVILDPGSLKIFDYNSALLEQYGFDREDLAKMTVLDLHPPEYRQKVIDSVQILKTNDRNDLGLLEHVKKNGQRILVEVSASRICYRNKDAVLATANDVTEKVRLQKQVVREKVNYQKGITKATLEAQEKERTEIATELHDNINQVLAAAKLNIENIVHCPEHSRHFVHKGSGLLQTAIDEIRRLSSTLTAPTLRGLTFYDALIELLEPYKDLGLFTMDYSFDFDEAILEEGLYLSAYRILQEQLNNTIKYAKASLVSITLKTTKTSFELEFKDNGIGFDPFTVKKGLGLNNIKNRVDAYNGKLSLFTSKGKGYCARISFPIQN
jgi:PAS domain S-box-containing protein